MADNMGVNPWVGTGGDIQGRAKKLVFDYIQDHPNMIKDHPAFAIDEVFIVWFNKSLQNWKALLSTSIPDGRYYEVTYDGDRKRAYIDVYHKVRHLVIHD